MSSVDQFDVYLEIGEQKIFASAIDWPGWSRSGRQEDSALQALFDYGPRYARAIQPARLSFQTPGNPAAFRVVEKLAGNSTTDFGAPDAAPSRDASLLDEEEHQRLQALLQACWQAFDSAVQAASGKELRKGPRGGGRDVDRIVEHVLGSDAGYLARLGVRYKTSAESSLQDQLVQIKPVILEALTCAAHGELPALGPRGGVRWTPRYYIRRAAWHTLDHAWEIEDRIL